MKAKMLKIAGVKSEKEFYQKFPDEASFMEAHGKEFKKAMRGSKIKKAQVGFDITGSSSGPQLTPSATNTQQAQYEWGQNFAGQATPNQSWNTPKQKTNWAKGIPIVGQLVKGIQMLKDERDQLREARQMNQLVDVEAVAASSRPKDLPRRQYLRPEDVIVQPEQMFPSYGVGTNVLAQDGAVIRDAASGNPTEIQNTYAPTNTLYDDLGYEPLNDTDQLKQFAYGGKLQTAGDGFNFGDFYNNQGGKQFLGNLSTLATGDNGGAQVGEAFGKALSLGLPIPGLDLAGKFIGGALDQKQKKIEATQERTNRGIGNLIGQATGLRVQNKNKSFMQGGGDAKNKMSSNTKDDCVKDGTCGKEEAQNKADKRQAKEDSKALGAYAAAVAREQKVADKQREQEYKDYLNEQLTGYGDKIKQKEFDAAYQAFAAQNPDLAKDRLLYTLANKELNKTRNNPDYRMRGILNRINPTINYGSLTLPQLMQTMQQGFGSGQGYYDAWKAGFPVPKQQDGGDTSPYEWVSHTWQPQVITQFGEHKVKDLLTPPKDADMLRAGGHLKEYTPPSAEAMQTDNFQMGGELQTHWGGYAEPLSQNPYLPEGGETVMFRGQSHDESDGYGNTGIGITYGENPVEVERGEPAVKLRDGGDGDTNLTVFGNIKITNAFADMLGDTKAAGKKFKHYVKDLSKQENKQNKLVDKSIDEIDNLDVISPFDQLKLGTLQANIIGGNAKLKGLAEKKMNAAALQNAINDTKEEEGLVDITDEGDVKAERGKRIPKAQPGITQPLMLPSAQRVTDAEIRRDAQINNIFNQFGTPNTSLMLADMAKANQITPTSGERTRTRDVEALSYIPAGQKKGKVYWGGVTDADVDALKRRNSWYDWSNFNPARKDDVRAFQKAFNKKAEEVGSSAHIKEDDKLGKQTASAKGLVAATKMVPTPRTAIPNLGYTLPTPSGIPTATVKPLIPKKPGFDWMGAFNQVLPYLRPSDVEQLDPNQLLGELYALSNNQVEPVWAQKVQPELAVPYDISLQDMLNANQADYNATQRLTGYNPAALASLNAQKYAANQRVLGEQFRLNQAEKSQVYEGNRALLNQYKLQNLGLLDQQYVRQNEALSKTKATTQAALNSIASKYAQNKLENRTLATYENLYNYRYDPRFRAINMNPLAQFTIPDVGSYSAAELEALAKQAKEKESKAKTKTSRNGSIVKNLKTL